MVNLRSARALSWLLFVGIVVVAVAAWGFYVWKSGTVEWSASATPSPSTAQSAAAIAQGESTPHQADAASPAADDKTTVPAGGSNRPTPSASVSVNAPGGLTDQSEMKLKEIAAGPAAQDASAARPGQKPAQPSKAQTSAESAEPKPSACPDLDAGRAALARGDLLAARVSLSAALGRNLPPADDVFARAELTRIADALIFSRATTADDPLIGVHVVAVGDSLNSIAKQNKITEELLISLNRIKDPNILPVGQRLKVIHGPFSAVIDKSAYRMDVYLGNVLVREFKVGLGTNDGTPRGTWAVRNKLRDPEWIDPNSGQHYASGDPESPIGARWIGLHCIEGECSGRTGFGLHGTVDPASIGRNASMGCIRLTTEDVAFAYDLFVEEISRVVIR